MKTILVHVDEHDALESVLACTLLAARRFDAHIDGLHIRPGVPRMVPVAPEGAFIPASELVQDLERADRERARRLRQLFEEFMRDNGIPQSRSVLAGDHMSADWQEKVSAGGEALGSAGRVYDLIVVGRPGEATSAPSMAALEAALFESGRPILIAPPRAPASLGDNVVIAWNGSTETARTIAMAMPFLVRAQQVLMLSVEEAMVSGPSGADVVQNLIRNGVPAKKKHIQASGRPPGRAMLDEAAAAGSDLLVKGAYTHSRLRQMIFGGATSHILAHAELPVIMAH